ncbi:hypothetical protein G3N56_08865 [Desulfovibrio sulfodismutans]|uniref:DUF4831 family protein n=1 Tax=Desulfolutivibrio sulfodismutans TaxID=63561 RepID=A0A7K3NKY3_9BACT|nr:hypothetical protein [Desulfolutivibrio sulfodismutans]NDY56851.1 hypothetical protein [Desulfolutivibrio sulfodismutans]QLA13884.1 hypothetical protein GD606_17255 [Desulfolutivibrio sulfodismutans DSM 3696]
MNMNNVRVLVMLSFVVVGLIGCSSKIRVMPYGETKTGIAFNLPKTQFQLKIIYTKRTSENCKDKNSIKVEKPLELTPLVVPDPQHAYVIDTSKLEASFVETKNFTLKLNEVGCITSINAEMNDRTSDVIASAVKIPINVAKIIAAAGHKDQDAQCIVTVEEIEVVRIIDLEELEFNKDDSVYHATYSDIKKATSLFNGIEPDDEVKLEFYASESFSRTENDSKDTIPWKYKNNMSYIDGLPYRLPAHVRVIAKVSGHDTKQMSFMIAQSSNVCFLPFSSKMFTERKMAAKFSPSTGGLTEYEFSTSSSAQKLASTLESATGSLVTGVDELRQAKAKAMIADVKNENDLLAAEKDLLQSRLDLYKKQEEMNKYLLQQLNN